jgi:hypothetical protein
LSASPRTFVDNFALESVLADPRAMSYEAPVCMDCKHYHRSSSGAVAFSCDAFPEGIPDEILLHRNPHTAPFPGDRGIQFEPIKKPAKAARVRSRRR